jgi:hypothetical protein
MDVNIAIAGTQGRLGFEGIEWTRSLMQAQHQRII